MSRLKWCPADLFSESSLYWSLLLQLPHSRLEVSIERVSSLWVPSGDRRRDFERRREWKRKIKFIDAYCMQGTNLRISTVRTILKGGWM